MDIASQDYGRRRRRRVFCFCFEVGKLVPRMMANADGRTIF